MITARQIMDSLRDKFGPPSIQIKQEAIKYIYNVRMKEGQSVREHVLDMIVNLNVAEMNRVLESQVGLEAGLGSDQLETGATTSDDLRRSTMGTLRDLEEFDDRLRFNAAKSDWASADTVGRRSTAVSGCVRPRGSSEMDGPRRTKAGVRVRKREGWGTAAAASRVEDVEEEEMEWGHALGLF
ncbi:gag/pol protein [Cucumis melo var. makuwa]|uniref:Gag/pol protein n=1 Tax=Cucumis melo var. makuwa TaxID=1194695 RepID=A0A5A7TWG3_CUCMM|nr:gag/pol protein [Cucumis melo var. makuwa]